jgi:hypothetical protein
MQVETELTCLSLGYEVAAGGRLMRGRILQELHFTEFSCKVTYL